jgi:hypothetical protein
MKRFFVVLVGIMTSAALYSQDGYYATQNTYTPQAAVIDGGDIINARQCQILLDGTVYTFTPTQVKEYGLKNGQVYISKTIKLADSTYTVFLERVATGKITLYFYRSENLKTFFFENENNQIFELPEMGYDKTDFRKKLEDITSDCPNLDKDLTFVNYNKKSLARLINMYNKCLPGRFPHFQYGVIIGFQGTKLKPIGNLGSTFLNNLKFRCIGGMTLGLHINYPVFSGDISLHSELKYSLSYFESLPQNSYNSGAFFGSLSTIELPLLFRYSFPEKKLHPFLEAGGLYSHIMTNKFYEKDSGGTPGYNKPEEYYSPRNQFGASVGAGIEYPIKQRSSLLFGIRYNRLYFLFNDETNNMSDIQIITGISF